MIFPRFPEFFLQSISEDTQEPRSTFIPRFLLLRETCSEETYSKASNVLFSSTDSHDGICYVSGVRMYSGRALRLYSATSERKATAMSSHFPGLVPWWCDCEICFGKYRRQSMMQPFRTGSRLSSAVLPSQRIWPPLETAKTETLVNRLSVGI